MILRLVLLVIGLASSYIGSLCVQNGSSADMAVGAGALLIGILSFFFLGKGLWRFLGCMTTFIIMAVIVGALFFFVSGSGSLDNILAKFTGSDSQSQESAVQQPAATADNVPNPQQQLQVPVQVQPQQPQQPVPTVGLPPGMLQQMQQMPQMPPSSLTGKITSIVSGDVFRMGQHTVRLYGIASPVIDQTCWDNGGHTYECGYVSARMLKDFVNGDDVNCRVMNINAQNELMAACTVGSFDIGAAMVEAGWAIALPAVTQIYLPYQQKAQEGRKGMWEGRFQMPWEWMAQKQQTRERTADVKMPKVRSGKKGKGLFDFF